MQQPPRSSRGDHGLISALHKPQRGSNRDAAPKSNALHAGLKQAAAAKATGSLPLPAYILNAPTRPMQEFGYGKGYVQDHETEDAVSGQDHLPSSRGFEREVARRLGHWAKLRQERRQ